MASFTVHGPFEIKREKEKGGPSLLFDEFWTEGSKAHNLAGERGCYVFAVRAGRGTTPIYIGQAAKNFKQETFNPANRNKYYRGFIRYGRGVPVMFFVVHPSRRGKPNLKQIRQIEDFLIQAGAQKNPNVQNVKGTQTPDWSIKGVVRSGVGRQRIDEMHFARMFGIHRRAPKR